jgi:hypothetical protein
VPVVGMDFSKSDSKKARCGSTKIRISKKNSLDTFVVNVPNVSLINENLKRSFRNTFN